MDKDFFRKHWYADIYEKLETQIDDVNLILELVGNEPNDILEVACGSGRISIPLANSGHKVTGFDFDEFMLEKLKTKANGLVNISFYKTDAVLEEWGRNYDIVILAGNILLNIESDMRYVEAQELFIKKASECVKPNGYLYLDFDCFERPEQTAKNKREWVCFEGTDDIGTYGKYIVISGDYSNETQIDRSQRRYEITPKGYEMFTYETVSVKHFPTFEQVRLWLLKYGWSIEHLYGDYDKNPLSNLTKRVIVWAKKN